VTGVVPELLRCPECSATLESGLGGLSSGRHACGTTSKTRSAAPLEKRYSRAEVESLLAAAGLVDVEVLPGYGWRAVGRRPAA
jgi:hypothetical protein